VGGPGSADQATHSDDGVGEVEEGVDHPDAAFVAACEPVEGVLPGVGALDIPALGGLDGGLLPLAGDLAVQAALGKRGARLADS
jgi:hypothetical protein